jgi:hypothetical protein
VAVTADQEMLVFLAQPWLPGREQAVHPGPAAGDVVAGREGLSVDGGAHRVAAGKQLEQVLLPGRNRGHEAAAVGVEAADDDAPAPAVPAVPDGEGLDDRGPARLAGDLDRRHLI